MTNSDRCNCKWCGSSEGYAGTQECDQCYNIRSAIETNPQLAARMLNLADDAAILDWMADNQVVEMVGISDWNIHEIAMEVMCESGGDDSPTVDDYRRALRLLIRTAMDDQKAAQAAEGE